MISDRVSTVFSSRPRVGTSGDVLWHKRGDIEKSLSQILRAASQNVCIDGPTGSGKTSLALTVLDRMEQPFIWIPITRKMDWSSFCETVIKLAQDLDQKAQEHEKEKNLSITLDAKEPVTASELATPWKFLKRIKFQVEQTKMDLAETIKTARKWQIMDLGSFLSTNRLCLLIDDFEKADDDLVTMVADLCKHLTFSDAPKCIIIGTGQTFSRLYTSDESLDGRLDELSVASFGSSNDVWHYINDGLKLLGFNTPREKRRKRSIDKSEADRIQNALYDAADGMPKYINQIALAICRTILNEENEVSSSYNVSTKTIINECNKMMEANLSRNNRNIRRAEKELKSAVESRYVLKAIFQLGANSVHSVEKIIDHVQKNEDPSFDYLQFSSGFEKLSSLGLYVQTGKSGEVIFARDPIFSHVLGLICKDPRRFNKDPEIFGLFGQRSLPLEPT